VMASRAQSLAAGLAWAVIIGNGVLAVALVAMAARKRDADGTGAPVAGPDDTNLILMLWLAGAALFIVLFAPFMAIRHLLPAVAPVLLLLGRNLRTGPRAAAAALALTAGLGVWLAASDFAYAEVYPTAATEIAASLPASGATRWTVGHWGWQWYAEQAGLQEYDVARSALKAGDYLVAPALPHQQRLPEADAQRLVLVQTLTVEGTPLTWLRTMSPAGRGGYYNFSIVSGSLPWTISTRPLDTFQVFQVR